MKLPLLTASNHDPGPNDLLLFFIGLPICLATNTETSSVIVALTQKKRLAALF